MKKTIVASLAVAAAFAITAPANATTVVAGAAGALLNTAGDTSATFDSVPGAPQSYGSVGAFGPFTDNGANFSGLGMIMLNTPGGTGDSLGLYAEPFHDTSNYLTVQPAGSPETIALNTTATRFGLYWGSMDTYNSIQFYRNGGLIDTVTGAQAAAVVPALANGNQADDATNRYIEISAVGDGLGFDTVVLLSSQNSFEVDNLSWGCGPNGGGCAPAPTPLPAALPLFISGLGGLGFFGFWRKKKQALKMAAA